MQGNVTLPLSNPPHGNGLEYLSQEDSKVQMEFEKSSGKVSIRGHGNEKVRIIVSESSVVRQHSENCMYCTELMPITMPVIRNLLHVLSP